MTQLRRRQKESIIRETLARISPAVAGSAPGSVVGVASYNGRTGNVVSTVSDIPPHATTHQPGGSDAMAVDAAVGVGSLRTLGAGAQQAAPGNDARLSDARTPTAHAPTHKSGGSDPIKLDELAAPTDILTLNASAAAHGLLPKLPGGTTTFLRADGTFAAPVASLTLATVELSLASAPNTRRSGHVQITGLAGLTAGKPVLVQQAAGPYTGKGSRTDEAEMDMLIVTGKVLDAATIDLYWQSKYQMRGNVKFDYVVAA